MILLKNEKIISFSTSWLNFSTQNLNLIDWQIQKIKETNFLKPTDIGLSLHLRFFDKTNHHDIYWLFQKTIRWRRKYYQENVESRARWQMGLQTASKIHGYEAAQLTYCRLARLDSVHVKHRWDWFCQAIRDANN